MSALNHHRSVLAFQQISFLICALIPLAIGSNDSVVIIAFPLSDSDGRASWENKLEVLPGAYSAIKSINHASSAAKLNILVVDSGEVTCDHCAYSGNLLEMIANFSWHNRLEEIVGIAGLIHPAVLLSLQGFKLPFASLVQLNGIPPSPNLVYMTSPTSVLVDSVIAFMKSVNQNTIGMFTESHHNYFSRVSAQFIKEINSTNFSISIPLFTQSGYEQNFISDIISSQLQVLFVSSSPSVAVQIVCTAYKNGLIWPQYLWILHSIRLDDLPSSDDAECRLNKILEGVLIFSIALESEDQDLVTGMLTIPYENYNINSNITVEYIWNPYTNLLYDAVWLLTNAQRENGSLKDFSQSLNISGASPTLTFDDGFLVTDIVLHHVLNYSSKLVGIYDASEKNLVIHDNVILGSLDIFNPSHNLLPTFIILYLSATFVFILNTLLLLLFILFRKDPDIKSTSVVLSLLLFVGCYLLTGFALNGVAFEQRRLIPLPSWQLCVLNTWLSGIGISVPLILATLLVKMVQVYYIFTRYKRVKRGVLTSSYSLIIYTCLIITPNVIILTTWSIVDPFRDEIVYGIYTGFSKSVQRYQCKSNHEFIFFGLLFAYFVLLSTAVVAIAIKTRKIRLMRFKDTKKVNLLIFLLLFIVCFVLAFWLFFKRLYEHAALIILCGGNLLAAFLCQVLLFIPKIWPPLRKKLICICPQKYANHSAMDHESHSYLNSYL